MAAVRSAGRDGEAWADRLLAKVRCTVLQPICPLTRPRAERLRRKRSRAMPLNHVALTVSDRVRSAVFYGEHFGLTERLHEDDHLPILGSDDGSELALSQGKPIA
jgi:hypothetical protein